MGKISQAVGEKQINRLADVRTVQMLINREQNLMHLMKPLVADGKFGPRTAAAIRLYQEKIIKLRKPDGVVSPNGITLRTLIGNGSGAGTASKPNPNPLLDDGISEVRYIEAARELDCEVAAIKAVAMTEAKRGAFDGQGRPTILFERHYFHKLTSGKHDKTDPDISNAAAGGYGFFSAQYPKLERAMVLDKDAAQKSASWGQFQIMGANHKAAGYETVGDFVKAMELSSDNHLKAFVSFIKSDARLLKAIQQKDWTNFAKTYNGPKYKDNDYDTKMKNNYTEILEQYDPEEIKKINTVP